MLLLHVPRTAGTSYGAALAGALGGPHVSIGASEAFASEGFQQVDVEELRRYAFVSAHVDYGLCRRAPFLRPATVLRDPVDRLVSWFHYARRDDSPNLAEWRALIEGRGLTAEEFLLHPTLRSLHGQSQTLQVAGHLWSGDPRPPVDELVPMAVANLGRFAHVGLFERLGDSLRLARAELGLDAVPELPERNVSPEPLALDPAVREEVAGLLGLDVEFHRAAVAEFERRLAAHGLGGPTTALPPPIRPVEVRPAPRRRATTSAPPAPDAAVGDRLTLVWSPSPGSTVGGPLAAPRPLVVPPGAVAARSGSSVGSGDDPPGASAANWLRVEAGAYLVQTSLPCRRFGADPVDAGWDLLVVVGWYDEPPIPGPPDLPGTPDAAVWLPQAVPAGLPELPQRGAPVAVPGLVSVPRGGGHLSVLVGSTVPIVASPNDEVRIDVVRVG